MCDWRSLMGAPKWDVSINRLKKSGGRAKKPQKYIIFDVPEMEKLVACVFTVEHVDLTLNVSKCA